MPFSLQVMNQPVVWANGSWVTPCEAVFTGPSVLALHAGSSAAVETLQREVADILLRRGVPIASSLPEAVSAALLSRPEMEGRKLTPAFLRRYVSRAVTASMLLEELPAAERLSSASTLLSFCLADAPWEQPGELKHLSGVALLPLESGELGALSERQRDVLIVPASSREQHLFRGTLACGKIIAAPADTALGQQLALLAAAPAPTNIKLLNDDTLATELLPHALPPAWHEQTHVPSKEGPEKAWLMELLASLRDRLGSETVAPGKALARWPMLPAMRGTEPCQVLCAPTAEAALLIEGSWSAETSGALLASGCSLIGNDTVVRMPPWSCINAATGAGVLTALASSALAATPELTASQRDALRLFLLQQRWFGRGGIEPDSDHIITLRRLPMYRCCGTGSADHLFTSLISTTSPDEAQPWFVAPATLPTAALPPSFVVSTSPAEASILVKVRLLWIVFARKNEYVVLVVQKLHLGTHHGVD